MLRLIDAARSADVSTSRSKATSSACCSPTLTASRTSNRSLTIRICNNSLSNSSVSRSSSSCYAFRLVSVRLNAVGARRAGGRIGVGRVRHRQPERSVATVWQSACFNAVCRSVVVAIGHRARAGWHVAFRNKLNDQPTDTRTTTLNSFDNETCVQAKKQYLPLCSLRECLVRANAMPTGDGQTFITPYLDQVSSSSSIVFLWICVLSADRLTLNNYRHPSSIVRCSRSTADCAAAAARGNERRRLAHRHRRVRARRRTISYRTLTCCCSCLLVFVFFCLFRCLGKLSMLAPTRVLPSLSQLVCATTIVVCLCDHSRARMLTHDECKS